MAPPVGDGSRRGAGAWIGMALGGAIVVWSARGAVQVLGGGLASLDPTSVLDGYEAFFFGDRLRSFLIWFAGGALLADLVVVPASAAAAGLVRRRVPGWAWPPVRTALLVTATLTLLASPMLLDLVDPRPNPTVRPRNTTTGWLGALVVVWVVTGLVVAVRRRGPRQAPGTLRGSKP